MCNDKKNLKNIYIHYCFTFSAWFVLYGPGNLRRATRNPGTGPLLRFYSRNQSVPGSTKDNKVENDVFKDNF